VGAWGGRLAGVSEPGATDRSGVAVPDEVLRARRLAARRAWRGQASAEFAFELAVLPGRRWERSKGASSSLLAPVASSPVIEAAVLAVWDLTREDPPPQRDRVYRIRGDFGPVVVAHADEATLLARSDGPYLVIADRLGRIVWRVDGDPVWAEDLAEIFRELVEVAEGRPAVDESQIPPMPRLPWHRSPEAGSGS